MTQYSDIIGRMDVATTTLEESVDIITNGLSEVSAGVTIVEDAVDYIGVAVPQVEQLLSDANTLNQDAIDTNAATQQSVQGVEDMVVQLQATAPFQEAPIDGNVYGRKGGSWEVVGGSEETLVASVNGKTGAVLLSATDVGALPDTYTPSWNDLDDKPTIPTMPTGFKEMAYVDDAVDNKSYFRKKGDWVAYTPPVIPPATAAKFPVDSSNKVLYNSTLLTEWVSNNPNTAAIVDNLKIEGGWIEGDYVYGVEGEDFFVSTEDLNYAPQVGKLPDANYSFTTNTFTSAPLAGVSGVIIKNGVRAFALTTEGTLAALEGVTWVVKSGGGGIPVDDKGGSLMLGGVPLTEWHSPNILTPISVGSLSFTGWWDGDYIDFAGGELFDNKGFLLPDGTYNSTTSDFTEPSLLAGSACTITKIGNRFTVITNKRKMFTKSATQTTWFEVDYSA